MQDGAEFAVVDLLGAKIDGQLAMSGSKFTGPLRIENLQVGMNVVMGPNGVFNAVLIRAANIADQLAMDGARFTGTLRMDSLRVRNHVFMRGVEITTPGSEIDLVASEIGGSLEIRNSLLSSLNLTDTKIGGELVLGLKGSSLLKWQPNSRLVLHNTEVGSLQDTRDVWPSYLELDGFRYGILGGIDPEVNDHPADRDTAWYINWLGRQTRYSPQPYEYLAGVLRRAGHQGKANEILYAAKNRELENAKSFTEWTKLFFLWLTIGYGYKYWMTVGWFLLLLGIGTFVYIPPPLATHAGKDKLCDRVFFSFDMLVPIIELDKRHRADYAPGLTRYRRIYFYVQTILGYVLAVYLIAGISGLAQ